MSPELGLELELELPVVPPLEDVPGFFSLEDEPSLALQPYFKGFKFTNVQRWSLPSQYSAHVGVAVLYVFAVQVFSVPPSNVSLLPRIYNFTLEYFHCNEPEAVSSEL